MDLNEFAKWAKNNHGFDCNELKFYSTALTVVHEEFTEKNYDDSEAKYVIFFKHYLEKLKEYLKSVPTNPLEKGTVINGIDLSGLYYLKSGISTKITLLHRLV